MSFSKQVKEELNSIQIKGNCCKKAYLFGAILASETVGDKIILKLSDRETAEKIAFLLKSIYKCESESTRVKRGCFECHTLSFVSKKLFEYLSFSDSFRSGNNIENLFTCQSCRSAFLRAVFCAAGSVSDPKKTYTLEIRVPNISRSELLCDVISEWGINIPSQTKRNGLIGLFYRNESSIEDFLTACGCNKALFAFFEASVEKNLRNDENRATNCVAKNISKSVEATALQISAIESLKATSTFDDLPREIRQSAILRIENPDMSLSELASLHQPPISKSGLNHRLSKIIEEAKKRNLL